MRGLPLALCATLALAGAAQAARPERELAGRVTRVVDGDSLWLQTQPQARPVEVRLLGIDAPEICQPWGVQARNALKARVGGNVVHLQVVGRDGYGRWLGRITLDGQDVNAQMVREGHAWSARTRWDDGALAPQERAARAARRGLHGQPGAVLPRDFRRSHGRCVGPAPES